VGTEAPTTILSAKQATPSGEAIERSRQRPDAQPSTRAWKALAPVIATAVLALLPIPAGLPHHAWYFFSIFVGVIVGLVLEPLPGASIAVISQTVGLLYPDNAQLRAALAGRKPGSDNCCGLNRAKRSNAAISVIAKL
jgi:Sodium:sulfate symporter transmembrane region